MAAPNYRAIAVQAARRAGIDPAIFTRQINQESGFNPNARSGAGAVGIAQIVPHWHPNVDATDPVASLNYAAQLMGTLVRKYGSYAEALSVYNSGKPEAYRDPNFSGGQTYNYVKSIMGGKGLAGPTSSPTPVSAPLSLQGLGGLAPSPGGLSGALRASLAEGNRMLGMAPMNLPAMGMPTFRPQPLPLPGAGGVPAGLVQPLPMNHSTPQFKVGKLAYVPPALSQRAGIQVNSGVLSSVEQIARQFGVRVSSGYRSAEHNKDVGGAPNSDHLRGNAVDFVGNPAQVTALYAWAQGKFPYIEPMSQARDHVHISFIR